MTDSNPTYPPYYIIPLIKAFHEAEGEQRLILGRRIAAAVGDPEALKRVFGDESGNVTEFYPDLHRPQLSTNDTIDSFLIRYGDPKAADSKEVKEVEALVPLPPAPFDLSELETLPESHTSTSLADPTSALLDSFLRSSGEEPRTKADSKEETPVLTESLARAMIKKGNYVKALEIITDLSLNNPKKSIYFADQIRFLKKLILNQSKGSMSN